jgi:hypothetical protein
MTAHVSLDVAKIARAQVIIAEFMSSGTRRSKWEIIAA